MLKKIDKAFKSRSGVHVAIISMIIFSLAGIILMMIGSRFPEKYHWLFINPSYTTNEKASWITGVWSAVLCIHGTIAALSITFMSMFTAEVSTSSKKRFESIFRKFIFNKYKFLNFSMEAACGLLTGIFLLSIGGGAIQYSISISISLFFIASYTKIYYRLYFLTENKNLVETLLLSEFNLSSSRYREMRDAKSVRNEQLSEAVLKMECIKLFSPLPKSDSDNIEDNFTITSEDENLVGFDEDRLKNLDKLLQYQSKNSEITLYLDAEFNRQSNIVYGKVIYKPEHQLSKIKNIKIKANNSFIFTSAREDAINYYECVNAVVGHLFDGLLSGDILSLDFGLQCVSNLSPSGEFNTLLLKLDREIASSGVEKNIKPHILAKFYQKLLLCNLHDSNSTAQYIIFNSMLDLPFYIYDERTYSTYFELISEKIEYLSRYEGRSIIDGYLDSYINASFKHMESRYYDVFIKNTDFLTKREYLENTENPQSLSSHQKLLLNAATNNITMILTRIAFIDNKQEYAKYAEETKVLFSLLSKWVGASFFKEVYSFYETYIQIFTIESRRDLSRSISKINEIPDGEVYGVSNHSYYMALLLLLYSSYSFGNFLSLSFIRKIEEFYSATRITTYSIEAMVKVTESEEFRKLCIKLDSTKIKKNEIHDPKKLEEEAFKRCDNLKSELENIKLSISKLISNEITQTKPSTEITEKYKEEITDHFIKNLTKIIDPEKCIYKKIYNPVCYERLVNKRELINPVDGCFYSRSPEIHSIETVYCLIRNALKYVIEIGSQIEYLEDIDDSISNRLVTIEYMIKDRTSAYRFIKGIKIKDDNGMLNLPEPGLYYMDIQADFELLFNKEEPLTITFKETEEKSSKEKNIDEHLSHLSIAANILIEPKDKVNLKFLSIAKCAELLKRKEEEYNNLIKIRPIEEPDDKL